MRLNRLDLNLVVCLDALLAERNVSRAAKRVFISQPAMSVALRHLRSHFCDELLVRVGRQYALTPFADLLQKSVRDSMLQLRAISDWRPQFDADSADRRITIEASDYVSTIYMSRLFQRAYERAPHIRFDLRILGSQFIEDLDSGVIDMLIIPKSIGSPDHPSAELFSDTFSCVVWKGNREIRDTITRQQYLDAGHVLAEWDGGRLSTIDESSFAQSGLARRREITAPSFSLAPQFLIGTQRIATIQTRLARHLAKHWPIRVLRCPIATPPITEIVQWHRHQEQDPAIRWLLDLMREVAREVTGDDAPAAGRVSRVRGSGRA